MNDEKETSAPEDSPSIEGTAENWENRVLGADERYVRVVPPDLDKAVDAALNLHRITLRLGEELFQKTNSIACENHSGIQWFIKRVLSFVVNDEETLKKALDSFMPPLSDESTKEKPE